MQAIAWQAPSSSDQVAEPQSFEQREQALFDLCLKRLAAERDQLQAEHGINDGCLASFVNRAVPIVSDINKQLGSPLDPSGMAILERAQRYALWIWEHPLPQYTTEQRRNGQAVKTQKHNKHIAPFQEKALRLRRRLGWSFQRIADLMGLAKSTARAWCIAAQRRLDELNELRRREQAAFVAALSNSAFVEQLASMAAPPEEPTQDVRSAICSARTGYMNTWPSRTDNQIVRSADRDDGYENDLAKELTRTQAMGYEVV